MRDSVARIMLTVVNTIITLTHTMKIIRAVMSIQLGPEQQLGVEEIPPVTENRQLAGDFDRMESLTKGEELVQAVGGTPGAEQLSLGLPET